MRGERARGGVSLLLTTHHLDEAEARCSRTVIIDHGRVIASGTLAELVDRTVGRHRVVMLRLDAPSAPLPRGVTPAADDPRLLRARVDDEDGSGWSRGIAAGLAQGKGLRVRTTVDAEGKGATLDRAAAERLVREGDAPVAVVLPKGLGAAAATFGNTGDAPRVQLLADVSDRIAPQMVFGLLQKVAMTSAPDILMQSG